MFFLVLLDALIAYLRFIQSQWFCVLICAAWQLGENLHWNFKKGHQENHLFDEIWNIFNLTNSMNLFLKVWRLPIAIISLFEYTFLSTIDSWDFSDMWRLEGTSEDRFSIYYHVKTLSRKRFGKNQTNTDYTVAEVGVAWQWCCLEGYGFSEMGHVPLGHMYWDIYASTSQNNSSFVAICTHTGYLEVKAVPSVSKL